MRICSLLPSATEILYSLGLGDRIVAVSEDCDYPPEVRQKPIISKSILSGDRHTSKEVSSLVENHRHKGLSIYDLDEELLRMVKPDLILTQELCDVCAVPYSQVLTAAKVLERSPTIISLEPRTLEDVIDNLLLVGKQTGTSKRAEECALELRRRIEAIRSKVRGIRKRPRVLCIEWTEPLMLGGHWLPEIVEIAGGIDGMVEVGEWTVRADWSSVFDYKPEVIVVMPCSYSLEESLEEARNLASVRGWETMPAVKNGQVYAVNAGWYFSRSGPRLVTGLEIMAEILHPELFRGLAPSDSYIRVSQVIFNARTKINALIRDPNDAS